MRKGDKPNASQWARPRLAKLGSVTGTVFEERILGLDGIPDQAQSPNPFVPCRTGVYGQVHGFKNREFQERTGATLLTGQTSYSAFVRSKQRVPHLFRRRSKGTRFRGAVLLSRFVLSLTSLVISFLSSWAQPQTDTIRVDAAAPLGRVNRDLFGTNLVTPWAGSPEVLLSDAFVERMRELGISRIRWPGGTNANNYNWRIHGWWRNPGTCSSGLDLRQAVELCQRIGCELQITVNFGTMSAHDAADLVRFCRDSLGVRVRYWEIGNEIHHEHTFEVSWTACNARKYYFGGSEERRGRFRPSEYSNSRGYKGDLFLGIHLRHGRWFLHFPHIKAGSELVWVGPDSAHLTRWQRVDFDTVAPGSQGLYYEVDVDSSILRFGVDGKGALPPEDYGVLCEYTTIHHDGYLAFVDSMKAVDPTIRIGACFPPDTSWSRPTLDSVFSHMDFAILHQYNPEDSDRDPPYTTRMGYANQDLVWLFAARRALDRWAGRYAPRIGLALTEWNFTLAPPLPKRADATLAAALFAAERLGQMLVNAAALRLEIADHFPAVWNRPEHFNTLLRGDDLRKRPVARVFELFHRVFGDTLLATTVACDSFTSHDRKLPLLLAFASRAQDRVVVVVVNKDSSQAHTARVELAGFVPATTAVAHLLTGPGIYADNEGSAETVSLRDSTFAIAGEWFSFRFPAHSVVALEIPGIFSAVTPPGNRTPVGFALGQPAPNPFSRFTRLRYRLDRPARLRVELYDVRGRRVSVLFTGNQSAGDHLLRWDGCDDLGKLLPAGVYLCRFSAGASSLAVRKVLLIR